jgi:multidrug efflux system membrane fusion protein
MSLFRRNLKFILPVAALLVGLLSIRVLMLTRPEVKTRHVESPGPLVRVLEVKREAKQLTVQSQGTVEARTDITLTAEVAGRIVDVSRSLASGGFFRKGDGMVSIDPRDFELTVVRARAQVAQAEVIVDREEAEAEVARTEWESLGEGEPSPLALREPQLAEARGALASARALLAQAELDLERSTIRAPFDGRVREKLADVGQFVSRGTPVARVYAVDYAEVSLPLADDQLAFLDIPIDFREEEGREGPEVRLAADLAGKRRIWTGRIVRVAGQIDERSRMIPVVARVDDPYGRGENPAGVPLPVGLFVEAEISGRLLEGVIVLPREALRGKGRVFIVDEDSRLRYRDVGVLLVDREEVVISSGIEEGEVVCLSPMETPVDGMKVRINQEGGEEARPTGGMGG